MGQKVNPIGIRLGINRKWESLWCNEKEYTKMLHEDIKIREIVKKRFEKLSLAKLEIERFPKKVKLRIFTARPSLVIGKKGSNLEDVRKKIYAALNLSKADKIIDIDITPIENQAKDAQLVSENVARQLERRIPFRRAIKKAIFTSMQAGVKGIKVMVSGRLGGAEMARTEWLMDGRVPLQTLRAVIDFGFSEANTKYGKIGVKAWIFKGEMQEIENNN